MAYDDPFSCGHAQRPLHPPSRVVASPIAATQHWQLETYVSGTRRQHVTLTWKSRARSSPRGVECKEIVDGVGVVRDALSETRRLTDAFKFKSNQIDLQTASNALSLSPSFSV